MIAIANPSAHPYPTRLADRIERARGALAPCFEGIGDRANARTRLALVPIGFLPVTLIAAATFGLDLRVLAIHVLLPALLVLACAVVRNPTVRRLVPRGLAYGMVATLLYDLFRWSFLWFGWMAKDPIPHIGTALDLHPDWVFGYAWRYLGNGGGMAIAFLLLGIRGVRRGALYGLFVAAGLLLVLVISPYGQEVLFPLNGTTVVMAIVGHLIYGAVLGGLAARRPVTTEGSASARHRTGAAEGLAERALVEAAGGAPVPRILGVVPGPHPGVEREVQRLAGQGEQQPGHAHEDRYQTTPERDRQDQRDRQHDQPDHDRAERHQVALGVVAVLEDRERRPGRHDDEGLTPTS